MGKKKTEDLPLPSLFEQAHKIHSTVTDSGTDQVTSLRLVGKCPKPSLLLIVSKFQPSTPKFFSRFLQLTLQEDHIYHGKTGLTMSAYSIMGERIVRLNEVAQHGNIEAFYSLISQEDVRILEHIDELPFVETPLHIAASAGGPQHIQFAMEMMRLKPSFARKPNLYGYSPIHLALQNENIQMVRRLLQVDGDLVRVKGKEGRTPLHDVAAVAAEAKELDLLLKFLSVCPHSIEDVTNQNKTALHIALESDKLEAFKLLVGWLRRNKSKNAMSWENDILNWEDEDGNTVLHVAVSKKKSEAVRLLLDTGVDIYVRNLESKTAWDIAKGSDGEMIRDMLLHAGASDSSLPTDTSYAKYLEAKVNLISRLKIMYSREQNRLSNEDRNVLLVVVALIVTITYQVILSPPDGLLQEKKIVPGFDTTATDDSENSVLLRLPLLHVPGMAIAGTNYFTFTISALITWFLLPKVLISSLFKMALVNLWVSYYFSLTAVTENVLDLLLCCLTSCFSFAIVLLGFLIGKLYPSKAKILRDISWYIILGFGAFIMNVSTFQVLFGKYELSEKL